MELLCLNELADHSEAARPTVVVHVLEFHHSPPHAQTGRTRTDELVTLCNWHHDVVERPGWQIRGDPDDADTPLELIQPNGLRAGTGPKPLDADLKGRLRGAHTNGNDP